MKQPRLDRHTRSRRIRLATLATTLTACSAAATPFAHAQTGQQGQAALEGQGSQAISSSVRLQFSISAGPLVEALAAYEHRTGIKVRLNLGGSQPTSILSPGVSGACTAEEALRTLLAGTGLGYELTQGGEAKVGLRHSDSVEVSSALPDTVAIGRFTQPLLDTPQSVVAVPQFLIEDEGVSTLKDALRNVPGISLAAGESGAQGDNLTIRGFTARNDIFLDGIRDFGSYYRDSFDYEQVDVLEGPAGVQFGRGSTGGVINQESKIPQAQRQVRVETQFGSNLERRGTLDFNQPLPRLGFGAAFRLNAMGTESGVAERDYAELRRWAVAPALTFGLNSPTRATLSYMHLSENDTPDYGLPWFYDQVAPGVNRSSYFGFPSANYLHTNDDILTLRVEHDFNPNLNLHTIARAANYPRNVQITEPQICSNASLSVPVGGYVAALPTLATNTRLPCPYTPATPPASITINRNQIQIQSDETDLWDQTEITTHFKLFGIRNELTGGAEGGQETSNPVKTSYTINSINTVPSTTLLNPNETQAFAGTAYVASITHAKADSAGVYFVDTLHLSRYFELSGGVRYDHFLTNFNLYQPAPPAGATVTAAVAPLSRVDQQPNYRAAFVYKPTSHGSIYFDYGTSFNPSAESLSLSVASSILPPEENETFEGGAKWSFLGDRLMVEGAVFRTEKDNARETDPTNSNNIVEAGNQLVKGMQASLVGRLPHGMDIVLGYAYLDSSVIASIEYPTSIGYPLANVPRQTFNFFVTHALPGRFVAGIGGNSVGSRTASSTVPYVPLTYSAAQTFAVGSAPCGASATACYQVLSTGMKQVPGYTVVNALLKRPIGEHLELQANVNNLFNRFYIDLPHPSHLIPGEGANALFGLNWKF